MTRLLLHLWGRVAVRLARLGRGGVGERRVGWGGEGWGGKEEGWGGREGAVFALNPHLGGTAKVLQGIGPNRPGSHGRDHTCIMAL